MVLLVSNITYYKYWQKPGGKCYCCQPLTHRWGQSIIWSRGCRTYRLEVQGSWALCCRPACPASPLRRMIINKRLFHNICFVFCFSRISPRTDATELIEMLHHFYCAWQIEAGTVRIFRQDTWDMDSGAASYGIFSVVPRVSSCISYFKLLALSSLNKC